MNIDMPALLAENNRLRRKLEALQVAGEGACYEPVWPLDTEAAEALRDFIGSDSEAMEVTLSVGEIGDDDGNVKYGLRACSSDYPEEGSILLCEMTALSKGGDA